MRHSAFALAPTPRSRSCSLRPQSWATTRVAKRRAKGKRQLQMESLLQRLVERTNEGDQQETAQQTTASAEDGVPSNASTRKISPSAGSHRQRSQAVNKVAPAAGVGGEQAQGAADDADKPKFLRAMEEREARRQRLKEERLTRMAAKQREAAVRAARGELVTAARGFCRSVVTLISICIGRSWRERPSKSRDALLRRRSDARWKSAVAPAARGRWVRDEEGRAFSCWMPYMPPTTHCVSCLPGAP
jgi:hypothetical protein